MSVCWISILVLVNENIPVSREIKNASESESAETVFNFRAKPRG